MRSGVGKPTPHGEAVTDEEITFYQHENALLIHHFVVPLPRWGRLGFVRTKCAINPNLFEGRKFFTFLQSSSFFAGDRLYNKGKTIPRKVLP